MLILDIIIKHGKIHSIYSKNHSLQLEKNQNYKKYISGNETRMLTCLVVLSYLDYRKRTLGTLPELHIISLQSIQNFAAKVTCKKRNMTALPNACQQFTGYQ